MHMCLAVCQYGDRNVYVPKWLKATVSGCLDVTGLYERRLNSINTKPVWLIPMYHRVIEDRRDVPYALGMCVTASEFDKQLSYFKKHFTVISLTEGIQRLTRGEKLPPRCVTITFDDGYQDNYTVALPLLVKHNIPATIFVVTGGMEEQQAFWWDRVIQAFTVTQKASLTLPALDDKPATTLSLNYFARHNSLLYTVQSLWRLPIAKAMEWVAYLERELSVAHQKPVLRLTVQQIQKLTKHNVEIGAHTVSHPNLCLMDDADVLCEMTNAKQALQNILGNEVQGFAYPGGFEDERIMQLAERAGFMYAVGTVQGINAQPQRFNLERLGVLDTSLPDLKRRLAKMVIAH